MEKITSWSEILATEKNKDYFRHVRTFVDAERKKGIAIYPSTDKIFRAFTETPLETLKVVILGQDPYHGEGQAEGLSFSVPAGIPIPPSLQNIFKELQSDIGLTPPSHGHLGSWATQGVLLLNAVLSVEANKASSHAKKGWEQFTDTVIQKISENKKHVVFLLWGNYAKQKRLLIDESKHLVLVAPHPSPLSAHNGFFGCKHFSQANKYLIENSKLPIDWILAESLSSF